MGGFRGQGGKRKEFVMRFNKNKAGEVINWCNRYIVPDKTYYDKGETEYPNEWFIKYFNFLGKPELEEQLGEAFYQARLQYKIMSALNLTTSKNKSFIKYQIIQYASICEALLDSTIDLFYKDESKAYFSKIEYMLSDKVSAGDLSLTYKNQKLYLCKEKKSLRPLKLVREDDKTKFAVEKGIITQAVKDRYDKLYELRNNIHILRATSASYNPRVIESKDAFHLMQEMKEQIEDFYSKNKEKIVEAPE